MLVSTVKIESTYRKVKHIREHMRQNCLAPDRAKLSVEDFQWCVCDMYGVTIEKFEIAFEGEFLRGLVERYESHARILIRAGQPDEWMRFTAVKELCHIAIDQREDWSPRGHETIQSLLLEDQLDQKDNGDDARELAAVTVQSERLAIIAATELMYPHEFRDQDLKEIDAGTATLRKIALHFHVPEYVIGSALHPGRIKLARMGWEMANR
jgi:Zn-dependent peptidase ImmA (M78 family)